LTRRQIKGLYFPARELLKRHVQSEHKKPLKLLVTTSIVLNFAFPGQSAYGPSKSAQQRIVEMIHADYQNQSVQVFGYHPGSCSAIAHRCF
jgi:NADP-dependent 3-hydroxy acid dehydrogenase YdfG